MNICVIIPSEDYLNQAGARIRYGRLSSPLSELGHRIELLPISQFTDIELINHDAYLISKCFDARALLIARIARTQGKLVGVDLFDDYFSQLEDCRFSRLRSWLDSCFSLADFVLCSTPPMETLSHRLSPKIPSHVMNDPYEAFDAEQLCELLAQKREEVQATGILRVAWYGMGDNPHFPVGLADLTAFSGELARLLRCGLDVRLDILTNGRAMSADALAALRRLPIPYSIGEWSEDGEKALLNDCHAAFLPVNAQNFSIVKSLNRAVTALCSGVQVLSAGYPLYERLAPFIYRDATDLIRDLLDGTPRLSGNTLQQLEALLAECADPEYEAGNFASFLESLTPRGWGGNGNFDAERPIAAIVHGRDSKGEIHKFARRLGALSVASPLSSQKLNFDVRFAWNDDTNDLDILVSEKAARWLPGAVAEGTVRHGKILDTVYRRVEPSVQLAGADLMRSKSPAAVSALHAPALNAVSTTWDSLFPDVPLILSEDSRLPWPVAAGFTRS